jgi:hypothetical protein
MFMSLSCSLRRAAGLCATSVGLPIASTAPLGKITDAFSAAMRRFARDRNLPWVDFVKGLTEALLTDEEDHSYDLSWLQQLPNDHIGAIGRHRQLLQHNPNPINRPL